MGNFNLNAATSFLKGYLSEQERVKNEKKINTMLGDKNYDVETQADPLTGQVQYRLKPKEIMTPYQQATIASEEPLRKSQAGYYDAQAQWLKTIQDQFNQGGSVSVDQNGNPVPEGTTGARVIKSANKSGITYEDKVAQYNKALEDALKRYQMSPKALGIEGSAAKEARKDIELYSRLLKETLAGSGKTQQPQTTNVPKYKITEVQ